MREDFFILHILLRKLDYDILQFLCNNQQRFTTNELFKKNASFSKSASYNAIDASLFRLEKEGFSTKSEEVFERGKRRKYTITRWSVSPVFLKIWLEFRSKIRNHLKRKVFDFDAYPSEVLSFLNIDISEGIMKKSLG